MEERRSADQSKTDVAFFLAVLYTMGYFGLVFTMVLHGIPQENESSINQLLGALTIVQTTIVGFFFGGSKATEQMQAANVARSIRSEAVVQQIAQSAPGATAAAVAATVAATAASTAPAPAIPLVPVPEVQPTGNPT